MSVIVITGCSSGFGFEAAKRFASRGDQVFATMRNPGGKNKGAADELQAYSPEGGKPIEVIDLDVTSDASVDAAAAAITSKAGAPDVVINNAGQMYVGLTEAFTSEELSRQLDVNVVGVHRVTRAFLPAMRARGHGLFINISSVAGRFAAPSFGVYNASKFGLESYSQALRYELASSGVDVVVVEPGPFTTELFPQSPHPKDADDRAASYPQVVKQTLDALGAGFEHMFNDPGVPTDPALVVDCYVRLVDMAPGTRPFRHPVGVDLGVIDRNRSDEVFDAGLLEAMGLTDFAKLKV
jgi:NAD(P)-dependent dehydrogenase (short-subunit alcohol dehydrogenase family)